MRVGEIAALSGEDVVTPGGERRPEIQLRPDQTKEARPEAFWSAEVRAGCDYPRPASKAGAGDPADRINRANIARLAISNLPPQT